MRMLIVSCLSLIACGSSPKAQGQSKAVGLGGENQHSIGVVERCEMDPSEVPATIRDAHMDRFGLHMTVANSSSCGARYKLRKCTASPGATTYKLVQSTSCHPADDAAPDIVSVQKISFPGLSRLVEFTEHAVSVGPAKVRANAIGEAVAQNFAAKTPTEVAVGSECDAEEGYPTRILGAQLDEQGLWVSTRTGTVCNEHKYRFARCDEEGGQAKLRLVQNNTCGNAPNDGVEDALLRIPKSEIGGFTRLIELSDQVLTLAP